MKIFHKEKCGFGKYSVRSDLKPVRSDLQSDRSEYKNLQCEKNE